MSKRQHHAPRHIQAVIAAGSHLFPSRTEKLSPLAPMVLHTRGRVGSRHFYEKPRAQRCVRGFLIVFAASGLCTCCLGEPANVASGSLQMQARKPASLGCPPSFSLKKWVTGLYLSAYRSLPFGLKVSTFWLIRLYLLAETYIRVEITRYSSRRRRGWHQPRPAFLQREAGAWGWRRACLSRSAWG